MSVSSAALAQQGPIPNEASSQQGADAAPDTNDIIVTARLRTENLQTVPLSISALSQKTLERAEARSLIDIARLTPGLQFVEVGGSGNNQTPIIRGLVQGDVNAKEGNVGVFLDGIYLANRKALDLQLLDFERIEVVKGPQSALYGQNSYAGAINYVSTVPGDHWQGTGSIAGGTNAFFEARAAVGGPIIADKLGIRLAIGHGSFDGTYPNAANRSNNLQGYSSTNASAIVQITPVQGFEVDLRAYRFETKRENDATVLLPNNCGRSASGAFTRRCGELPTIAQSGVPLSISPQARGVTSKSTILAADLHFHLTDTLTFTTQTAHFKSDGNGVSDADLSSTGTPLPVINTVTGAVRQAGVNFFLNPAGEADSGWSQELRLAYQSSRLSATLGGYYFDERSSNTTFFSADSSVLGPNEAFQSPGAIFAILFATPDPINRPVASTVTSDRRQLFSGFGQLGYELAPGLRLEAEARYTSETRSLRQVIVFKSPSNLTNSATFNFWTPRFSVDYKLNDQIFLFASAARGVRSGGFNPFASPTVPSEAQFGPETNWTYEAGIKTTLLNHRLTANATFFYSDLKGLQVVRPTAAANSLSTFTTNEGNATAKGVEIETSLLIARGLRVGLNYAYTDPTYNKGQRAFGVAACGIDASACGAIVVNNATGIDISGHQLPLARKHQASASLSFERPLSDRLSFYTRIDGNYASRAFQESINTFYYGRFADLDAKIGLTFKQFDLSVFAKNLTDEQHVTYASFEQRASLAFQASLNQNLGRIVGARLSARF